MRTRTLHKVVGLVLLLPFMAWIITAMVFYIKPGYAAAYESLRIKTYPLDGPVSMAGDSTWLEVRYLKTVLGHHVLVRSSEGWKQLDTVTLRPREKPADDQIRKLLEDAFSSNPNRYGQVTAISNDTIRTSTNIVILFDWNDMSLYQRGPDTDRIDLLYKIHYLQWTGISGLDKILGPVGLTLVFTLSVLGVWLAVGRKRV